MNKLLLILFFVFSLNVSANETVTPIKNCGYYKTITASLKNGLISNNSYATIGDAMRDLIQAYGSDFIKSYSDSGNSNTVEIILKDLKEFKIVGSVSIKTTTFCKE